MGNRLAAILGAVAALAVGVPATWVATKVSEDRQVTREFEAATDASRLMGKTPTEIIGLLGEPYWAKRGDQFSDWRDKDLSGLVYKSREGEYCTIEFKGGRASGVYYWWQ